MKKENLNYQLIDCGDQKKLEAFGPLRVERPCPQAVWKKHFDWKEPDVSFTREGGWKIRRQIPQDWSVELEGVKCSLKLTDFGHVGLFPEHAQHWKWMQDHISRQPEIKVLNLFAYSGGASVAASQQGASLCHVDASQKAVNWAKENALLNGIRSIRWIVDDAMKFLKREISRGVKYRGVIFDPPSFGRGSQGQVFKIEDDIQMLLHALDQVLEDPVFILMTSHTPGFTPTVLRELLKPWVKAGNLECGEMVIRSESGIELPCGSYGRWSHV